MQPARAISSLISIGANMCRIRLILREMGVRFSQETPLKSGVASHLVFSAKSRRRTKTAQKAVQITVILTVTMRVQARIFPQTAHTGEGRSRSVSQARGHEACGKFFEREIEGRHRHSRACSNHNLHEILGSSATPPNWHSHSQSFEKAAQGTLFGPSCEGGPHVSIPGASCEEGNLAPQCWDEALCTASYEARNYIPQSLPKATHIGVSHVTRDHFPYSPGACQTRDGGRSGSESVLGNADEGSSLSTSMSTSDVSMFAKLQQGYHYGVYPEETCEFGGVGKCDLKPLYGSK